MHVAYRRGRAGAAPGLRATARDRYTAYVREPVFTDQPLTEILAHVAAARAAGAVIAFWVADPDLGAGRYPGESIEVAGVRHVHRSWRTWAELAERLGLRLATPHTRDGLVRIALAPLGAIERWASYGAGSAFARIDKLEDPGFVIDLGEALARCALAPGARVLSLGVNTGDELALIYAAAPAVGEVVGIDRDASALAIARDRFPRATLLTADLAQLADLALGRFDLAISLNTLQSPGIDDRAVLRRVVQDHLAPTGAVILGVPNSRYLGGELEYGARMRNFRQPELGLLIKDVAFYRKYLQQHARQVFVTGKHHVLVTAVAAAAPENTRPADAAE